MINKLFSTFNLEFYLYYNYGWVLSIIYIEDFCPKKTCQFIDINHDKNVDLVTCWNARWSSKDITLFNSFKNRFEDTTYQLPKNECDCSDLIDSANNIYWAKRDFLYFSKPQISILYSINGLKFNWLYQIEYKKDRNGIIKAINLFKYKNNKNKYEFDLEVEGAIISENKIFIKRIPCNLIDLEKFNDEQYWRTHYKLLLGYK